MAPEKSKPKINWSTEPLRTIYAVVEWIRDTSENEKAARRLAEKEG